MDTNDKLPNHPSEQGLALLAQELAHLSQTMEQLATALTALLQAIRRPDVQLQLALEARAPAADEHLGRN